jgi:predicted RNase H-like HicB family nuclease
MFYVRIELDSERILIMYKYLIVIEPGEHNYSAYVPDLPGCITTGDTLEEVKKNMVEAINLHLRGMIEDVVVYCTMYIGRI